jgi:hypothetical protein
MHSVFAMVDTQKIIPEVNEFNNTKTIQIRVRPIIYRKEKKH